MKKIDKKLQKFTEIPFVNKIEDLLDHPNAEIQLEALIIIGMLSFKLQKPLPPTVVSMLHSGLRNATNKEEVVRLLIALRETARLKHHAVYLQEHNILNQLLNVNGAFLEEQEVTRGIIGVIESLLRHKPRMGVQEVLPVMPIIISGLNSTDVKTISFAAYAISHLLDANATGIAQVLSVDETIAPTLVQLLLHPNEEVVVPSLLAVGNIITGDDSQSQIMVDLQVVPSLLWLLDYPNKNVQKESIWTLANLAAGTHAQIQALIDCGVVPKVMPFMKYWNKDQKAERALFKEAAWLLCNILQSGNGSQVKYLINENTFEAICDPLRNHEDACENHTILQVLLEGFGNVLNHAVEDGTSMELVKTKYLESDIDPVIKSIFNSDIPRKMHHILAGMRGSLEALELMEVEG